ncbi:hypothetical protein [uncultured Roseibium sp.]|uniref:hypothetical protein n=1 Tax=uncultured Roseibium sp. TaxID=1936171 RepID=UPI002639EAD0|nr:hypothetical protein [uncultured Roseibium sp.]
MREELKDLADEVMLKKSWAPSTLEKAFGSPGILNTINNGKYGPTFGTAERFKTFLQKQLSETSN